MRGTPVEGRVFAKTGTLSNVRALSGYVTTLEGETLVFSMMANNFRVPTAEIDAIMERALNRIVAVRNEELRTKN
jgi:D-alanyl-D-alanine carboxypeptidase/D-alanyl-D-alanine-endopeptidase (penicillin-binding protein 4)